MVVEETTAQSYIVSKLRLVQLGVEAAVRKNHFTTEARRKRRKANKNKLSADNKKLLQESLSSRFRRHLRIEEFGEARIVGHVLEVGIIARLKAIRRVQLDGLIQIA